MTSSDHLGGPKSALIAIYMVALFALNLGVVWQWRDPIARGYGDFSAFYTAGKLLREGKSAQLYDPRAQWEVQQEFASTVDISRGPMPYIRPPYEALLFFPLSYLSYPAALVVWSFLKLLMLAGVSLFVARMVNGRLFPTPLDGLLLVSLYSVGQDFLQGQDAVLLLLVLAGVLRLLEEQKNLAAGCVLALGLFKFHLVLPLAAILILRRRLSFLAGFISIAFVEGLISIALVGWSGTLDYPGYLLRTSFGSGTGMTTWHNMPNLRAILTGLSGSRIPLWLGVLVMGAGVIFVTRLWRESAPESPQLLHASFSLAIATTILTSYYAYTYDL